MSMRTDEIEARGLPWATFSLVVIWFLIHVVRALGVVDIDWNAWGMVPGDLAPASIPTHLFLFETWPHLLGTSLVLLAVGPALEARWGRVKYLTFLLLAGATANATFAVLTPGLLRPVVGIGAGVTALLGAATVLYWNTGIQYTAAAKLSDNVPATLNLPAFLLAPLWLASQILIAFGSNPIGMTRGSGFSAQITGLAIGVGWAFLQRKRGVDLEGASDSGSGTHPALRQALAVISVGKYEAAFDLLEQAARQRPGDSDIITNLWETACACHKVERAAPLVLLFVQQQITEGDATLAVSLWCELVGKAPNLQAHPRALIELATVLRRDKRMREAAWTLRCAAQQRALLPGAALRIAQLARGVHPSTGIAAAQRALETSGLEQNKRTEIETLIEELKRESASQTEFDLDAGPDRSIEIQFEDPLAPPPGVAKASTPDPNAVSAFELSEDGGRVVGDTQVDLADIAPDTTPPMPEPPAAAPPVPNPQSPAAPLVPPPDAASSGSTNRALPGPTLPPTTDDVALGTAAAEFRFQSVKVSDAVPVNLGADHVELERPDGKRGEIKFTQVQALAVGAIHGLADKPVIVIDLVANWNELNASTLRVVRLRSDQFNPRALAPDAPDPMQGLRSILDTLLRSSGATPLPDAEGAHGRPFRMYPDLATYQRSVLQAAS